METHSSASPPASSTPWTPSETPAEPPAATPTWTLDTRSERVVLARAVPDVVAEGLPARGPAVDGCAAREWHPCCVLPPFISRLFFRRSTVPTNRRPALDRAPYSPRTRGPTFLRVHSGLIHLASQVPAAGSHTALILTSYLRGPAERARLHDAPRPVVRAAFWRDESRGRGRELRCAACGRGESSCSRGIQWEECARGGAKSPYSRRCGGDVVSEARAEEVRRLRCAERARGGVVSCPRTRDDADGVQVRGAAGRGRTRSAARALRRLRAGDTQCTARGALRIGRGVPGRSSASVSVVELEELTFAFNSSRPRNCRPAYLEVAE
ncbi:hypothetical protein DFH09DRAFT_1096012 [Mycena vulgaris]|nr:hypothetical protein DFH09DRAFT_1096012 [Mycena vulgaris]